MSRRRRSVRSATCATLTLLVGVLCACNYDFTVGGEDDASGGSASDASTPEPPDSGGVVVRDAATLPDAGRAPTTGECGPECRCAGSSDCNFRCTQGRCTLTCRDEADCRFTCADGAQCTIDCAGDANCNMECAGGAQCTFQCTGDSECRGRCGVRSVCSRLCTTRCDVDCAVGAICL